MSTEQNKILVRRFLAEVWVQGNLDNLEEMIAASHVHHLTRRQLYGPEGVQELAVQFRTFLADVQITIHDLLADGDKVVAYFTFSGIDQGGTMGHPPSGKLVSFAGIDIFQVLEDKIVARWGIVDSLSVLYQIGAMA